MEATLEIPLSSILADSNLQPRVSGIDPDHVREIQDAFELCPPIRVAKSGGTYVLLDGFHRFAAAQNIGLTSIAAEIIEPDSDDLFALAFALNAAHGKPLTLSDRRNYAARILMAQPSLSDREIGRRCGLMQPTIAKVRQDLERKTDIPVTTERTGRDGQTYPVAPRKIDGRVTLSEVINNILPPAGRAEQRKLTAYLRELAVSLEQQDNLPGFETIDDAVVACKAVLGDEGALDLANRLGWSSLNVFKIAQALGFIEEPEA